MTTRFLPCAAALLLGTVTAAGAGGHATVAGYALAGEGRVLLTMSDLQTPGMATRLDLAMPVDAIAYRPVTGALLGFAASGAVYEIDPRTGAMTDLQAAFAEDARTMGAAVAFDFNNAIDAVRAVGSDGVNLVYFPVGFGDNDARANSVLRFTDLFYAEGDAHEGAAPMVFANAYTNAIAGMTAGSTAQYVLDAQTDALAALANNAGTLTTVAQVTVDGMPADLAAMGGFDIVSPEEGTDMAYAVLQMEGAATAGLYAIDLGTGAATLMSDLGMGGITGFAASLGM